jgi:hypothetical protein
VDKLAAEYDNAGQPVLFLEQNIDDPLGNRIDRWWDSFGTTGSPAVPLMMVDSGHLVTYGLQSFATYYAWMVDQELARPPKATVSASWHRVGPLVYVATTVTNDSDVLLGPANRATVNVVVFERIKVSQTSRYVRGVMSRRIADDLPPGATWTSGLVLKNVPLSNWDNAAVVVMVDYQPIAAETRWDMLQAVIALQTGVNSVFLPGLFSAH